MVAYKNTSMYPLEFYGVTFGPGEIKEVPGWINCPQMERVSSIPAAEAPKETKTEKKPAAPKTAEKSDKEDKK